MAMHVIMLQYVCCSQKGGLGFQWQKRWLTVDSESLRYYSNNKVYTFAVCRVSVNPTCAVVYCFYIVLTVYKGKLSPILSAGFGPCD